MQIDLQICITVYKKTSMQLINAIESCPNYVSIRVDIDGGWDHSELKLESIKNSNVEIIIHETNLGLGKLRNLQLKDCKHKWIQFLDADDTVNEIALRYAEWDKSYKPAFIVSPINFITKDNHQTIDYRNLNCAFTKQSYFVIPSIIFRPLFLKINHLEFDESKDAFEDVVFSVKLSELKQFSMTIDTPYYNYNLPSAKDNTLSTSEDSKFIYESTMRVIKNLQLIKVEPQVKYLRVMEECLRLLALDITPEERRVVIDYMKPYKYNNFGVK